MQNMLSDLPFTLAKHFQVGGIDNQIGNLDLGWLAVCHLHGAGVLADTSCSRGHTAAHSSARTASRAGPVSPAGRG